MTTVPVFENRRMKGSYLTLNTLHDKYTIPAQQAALPAQQNSLFTQVMIANCADLYRFPCQKPISVILNL